MKNWLKGLLIYRDPRLIILFFLGFSSGLPRLLVYSTLTFWLLEEGLSIKAVGLFAATSSPYSLKFLWAPILDRLPLPFLTRLLGRRRSWILLTQLGLVVSIGLLASTDPARDAVMTAIVAIVIAFFSASQDVVIDAYRVDILDDSEQGAGAAVAVFGYRLGMLVAGAGALYLATYLKSWPETYLAMAAMMGVGIIAVLFARPVPVIAQDRGLSEAEKGPGQKILKELYAGIVLPLADFFTRPGWGLIVLFVVLYKLGDALAGTMLNPFLIDLKFTKIEIANVAKSYGLFATLFGVFLGGWSVRNMGVIKALWFAGFVQMASNLMFALQAVVGNNIWMLVATIGVENITGGLGTAAFVAYLSGLCNKSYTATQYALLTALSSVLRTLLASVSGFLVVHAGWFNYFVLTTFSAVPGMLLLYFLLKRGQTGLASKRYKEDKEFSA